MICVGERASYAKEHLTLIEILFILVLVKWGFDV